MDNKKPYTAAFTQPIISPQGADMNQPMGPAQMAQPMQGQPMPGQGMPNMQQNPITGQPMISQSPMQEIPAIKRDTKSLVKTIAIIALSLLSLTFIGLFIWMLTEYTAARTDVDGQIADAVVKAVDENTTKLEDEFTEREKYPFKTFAGPADYGELTFEYPKTWSVYIAQDASNGGDFEAYFNPVEVSAVSDDTIDSLRLSILNEAFDDIITRYQREIEGDEPAMQLNLMTIGQGNNVNANVYSGIIPGTEFRGYVTIFKIRDKTVVMQTDSVLFESDYSKILASVRFNA